MKQPSSRFRALERDRFDVIIVGAGIGGLTCGALLATRGKSVLVIDQHYVPGGNATIFKRPGYEFDVGIHYLGACQPGGPIPKMLAAGGVDDVVFRPLERDAFDTLVFPDFTFGVPAGLHAYRDKLVDQFPAEKKGIDRYIAMLEQVKMLMAAGNNPKRIPGALWKARLAIRYGAGTLGAFLDTCTRDPKLRAVLAAENGDYGQPPSRAALGMHAALMLHYLDAGGFYPEGGGQIMSDRLADSIEAHGGKVLLLSSVEKILVDGGRATGVKLTNKHLGERIVRADTVISNADLKNTLLHLVGPEHLPSRLVTKTRGYEMSPGLGVVYLGLKRDMRAEGMPNTNYWIYPSYDLEGMYRDTFAQRFTEKPFVYVSTASLKDPHNPNVAPAGHSNLQVMSLAPSAPRAWGCTSDEAGSRRYSKSERYRELKQEYAARLIEGTKPVLGDIREQIAFEEVATPLTHARYTRASGGTSYGIALTPDQFLHKRPGATTPIKGLFLCGASLRTGHGIMGAMTSGVFAAAEVAGKRVLAEAMGPGKKRRASGRLRPATSPA